MVRWFRLICVCLALSLVVGAPSASAHPEDEFCTGDGGLDPALCRALQDLDRSKDAGPQSQGFTETDVIDFERPAHETFALYVKIGVQHILPGGLDHILFVLALFFSTTRLKPLLIQISAFTVAHTATLALVASGVLSPPASIVEPLIAATIAFVAIENVVFKDMTRWRPFIVFGFGLIHGMGFAGFFGSLGLPDGQFWSALIGFNVGVEIGQLSVVLAAFVLCLPIRRLISDQSYRHALVWPASGLIGATGLFWTIERLVSG
ncbi:MAG: HupE/UreJ family protein [Hyphomonas sp.]|nr:HupE/UreJ family protein [Hyphomonas sp.]